MTAYNVVRFRTKAGQEQGFIEAHEKVQTKMAGLHKASLVKTGERTFCFVGEWDSMESLAAARPAMISILDTLRPMLEDLGGGLGLTDPVSGTVVADIRP